jgi:hypothetical protein
VNGDVKRVEDPGNLTAGVGVGGGRKSESREEDTSVLAE